MFSRRIWRLALALVLGVLIGSGDVLGVARASAPVEQTAIAEAVTWLHAQQVSDGSFGFRQKDGTVTPDAKSTADVIYALALVGENPTGPAWTQNGKTPLDALAQLAPGYVGTDAGQAAKVARAVLLAGGDPRQFAGMDLIAIIKAAYNPATGRYHPSFLFRHALAVEALIRAGETIPPAAFAALKGAQRGDGGWSWGFGGTLSDVDTTGYVLRLLSATGEQRCVPGYRWAARYLAATQLPEGGWNDVPAAPLPRPANANSTALAVTGLRATGVDPDAAPFVVSGKSAWAHLLAFQEVSGAFVYINQAGMEEVRLMATVEALVALAEPLAPVETGCPTVYLPLVLAR